MTEIANLVATGALEFDIAATYPLDKVADAFVELERRHTRGKIVLLPSAASLEGKAEGREIARNWRCSREPKPRCTSRNWFLRTYLRLRGRLRALLDSTAEGPQQPPRAMGLVRARCSQRRARQSPLGFRRHETHYLPDASLTSRQNAF
jgi:hypothetical protein